jgi:hypothetical protein
MNKNRFYLVTANTGLYFPINEQSSLPTELLWLSQDFCTKTAIFWIYCINIFPKEIIKIIFEFLYGNFFRTTFDEKHVDPYGLGAGKRIDSDGYMKCSQIMCDMRTLTLPASYFCTKHMNCTLCGFNKSFTGLCAEHDAVSPNNRYTLMRDLQSNNNTILYQ